MSLTQNAFIFTNSPFLLSQVSLASFVPNIGQPHQDAKRPYEVQSCDYSVQADTLFEGQLDTSSKTMFEALATKFAWFSASHEKSNTVKILAESGKIYSLNNPDDVFQSIVFGLETGPNIQQWLERCKLRRMTPRFVTGYRTFIDANVSREYQAAMDVSGGATIPVSSALGDPLGVADIEIKAGRQARAGAKSSVSTPGERIYAICYRKIKIKEIWGSSATPSLDSTNQWKPFASFTRGKSEEDMRLEAQLSKGENDEVEERYEAKSANGDTFVFGIISDIGGRPDSDADSDFEE